MHTKTIAVCASTIWLVVAVSFAMIMSKPGGTVPQPGMGRFIMRSL